MNLLEAMKTFIKVAELGGFSAAANQIGVGRSAVSRQIAALEEHLGGKLLLRSSRSISLTAAGAVYLEKCREILQLVESSQAEVLQESLTPRGPISISLPLSFGLSRLMAHLLAFRQQYPDVLFTIHFSDSQLNLIEAGVDLAIRITDTLQPTDIVRRLGSAKLLTVAAPAYLHEQGEPAHPSELSAHSCLGYSMHGNNQPWHFTVAEVTQFYQLEYVLQANNGEALAMAAAAGAGITLLPDFIAEPYLQSGALQCILQPFAPPELGVYALLASNRFMPHRIRLLVDYLAEQLAT